jgi:hypothetical protein
VAGLDPDDDLRLLVVAQQAADERVEPGHPPGAVRQPPPGQHLPALVHHLDVVMVLRPVVTREQPLHPVSRHP